MYGYIRPQKDRLLVRELEQYRAAYCGLCAQLGKSCGLPARFLVNYDLAFLYCLLTGTEEPRPVRKCRCPANPLRKKTCSGPDEAMAYTADLCMLLGWYKLRDSRTDERFFRRVGASAALLLLRRGMKKAAARRPEEAEHIRSQLAALRELELSGCAEPDRPADAFAMILARCAQRFPEEELQRPARQLLYHVGRFVYLCDAWDDLEKDTRSGSYNPLALRFRTTDGRLSPEDSDRVRNTLLGSVRLAGTALDLLPLKRCAGLLENIINFGMPAVADAVAEGTFSTKTGGSDERSL